MSWAIFKKKITIVAFKDFAFLSKLSYHNEMPLKSFKNLAVIL